MNKKDLEIERFGIVPFLSRLKSFFLVCVVFLLTFIFIADNSFAAQIRIAWDPNTEIDLAGYKVFYGTSSGVYGTPINVGNTTNYTLTGLTAGQNYYLSLKAYDTANNESSFSNEVMGVATDPGSVTLNTNPSGLQIVVDGVTYTAPQNFSWAVGSSHTVSVASPLAGATGTRYVFSSWSDGAAQTHTLTVPSAGAAYTANFVTQYSLTTAVSPANGGTVNPVGTNWYNSGQSLSLAATASAGYTFGTWSGSLSASTTPYTLTMDGAKTLTANFSAIVVPGALSVGPITGLSSSGTQGGPFASSSQAYTIQNTGGAAINWAASKTQSWVSLSAASGTLAAGASVTVTASINSNANSLGAGNYSDTVTFTNATNGGGNATRTVNLAVTVGTYAFQIATNPSGLQVVIDGVTYTAPQTLNWAAGTSHALSVSSPQGGTTGTRYAFSSWSDGGTQAHTITAPSANRTYTANFATQYSLTTAGAPATGGTVSPAATTWYNSGQSVTVTATAASGYAFSGWSGNLSGAANPGTLTMDGAKSLTANFVTPGALVITPSAGLSASGNKGGPFSPSSQAYTLQNTGGATINWSASKGQNWVTLSAISGTIAAGGSATVTASINSNANGLNTGSYSDTITFTNATNGTGKTTRSVALAVATNSYSYTLSTNPSGLQVVVDGTSYTAPQTFTWALGTSHALSVSSPLGGTNGTRYLFSSWSDGGAQSHTVTASSGTTTYTANFTTQYSLTTSVSPAAAGTITPSGVTWYNRGRIVSVAVSANSGFLFSAWSGSLTGAANPATVTMDSPKTISSTFNTLANLYPSIGVFRNGAWYLDNNGNGSWDGCQTDICIASFGGIKTDIPVTGDWTGDGSIKVGIYRNGKWYLDLNGNGIWEDCRTDKCAPSFGGSNGDIPVVGDWTGDRVAKIGIYRKGQWYLDKNGNGAWDGCTVDSCLGSFGGFSADIPIVGNWTGDGVMKIGIYRQGQWFLDKNGNGTWEGCEVDICLGPFGGVREDIPVIGDWDHTGKDKIGIYRNGHWFLDLTDNGKWDGCGADICVEALGGFRDDLPVVANHP